MNIEANGPNIYKTAVTRTWTVTETVEITISGAWSVEHAKSIQAEQVIPSPEWPEGVAAIESRKPKFSRMAKVEGGGE